MVETNCMNVQDCMNAQEVQNSQHIGNSQISNFVETVRLEQHPDDLMNRQDTGVLELEQARDKGDKTILEAEKFRAKVDIPGNEIPDISIMNIGSGVSDDDFFHLTCHIEPSFIHKIKKGEYVELEKLLPKDKVGARNVEENRLEWVQRDGGTYLVLAQRDNKIAGFR